MRILETEIIILAKPVIKGSRDYNLRVAWNRTVGGFFIVSVNGDDFGQLLDGSEDLFRQRCSRSALLLHLLESPSLFSARTRKGTN